MPRAPGARPHDPPHPIRQLCGSTALGRGAAGPISGRWPWVTALPPARPPQRRARRASPPAGLAIERSHPRDALPASPCSAAPAPLRSPPRYSSSFCPQRTSRAGPAGAAMARGGRRDRRGDVASLRTAPRRRADEETPRTGRSLSPHRLRAVSAPGGGEGPRSGGLRSGERGGSPGSPWARRCRLRSPGCLPQPPAPPGRRARARPLRAEGREGTAVAARRAGPCLWGRWPGLAVAALGAPGRLVSAVCEHSPGQAAWIQPLERSAACPRTPSAAAGCLPFAVMCYCGLERGGWASGSVKSVFAC